MTSDETSQQAEVSVQDTQQDTQQEAPPAPTLTIEQEINALRAAHQFFSNFDRVPGFAASQWSQALDTIALVANSLINKTNGKQPDTDAAAVVTTDDSVTQ